MALARAWPGLTIAPEWLSSLVIALVFGIKLCCEGHRVSLSLIMPWLPEQTVLDHSKLEMQARPLLY